MTRMALAHVMQSIHYARIKLLTEGMIYFLRNGILCQISLDMSLRTLI